MSQLKKARQHLKKLCREHKIRHDQDQKYSHTSGAELDERWFQTPPVRSLSTYAIALHEIGHLATRTKSLPSLYREGAAWKWAKDHALFWTPAMERTLLRGLQSHLQIALTDNDRGKPNPMALPPVGHPFWQLAESLPEASELLRRSKPSWLAETAVTPPWSAILHHPSRPRCSNCAFWQQLAQLDHAELPEKRTVGLCVHKERPLGVENTPGGAFCGSSWIRS